MLLTIIRHGETTWNILNKVQGQANPPLTQAGIDQAQEFADSFAESIREYAAIYSSTLQRAMKTANIIKGSSELPVIGDIRLNSRSLGDFSGKTLKEIKQADPETYALWTSGDPSFCPPNGESTEELLDHTQDFIAFLRQSYPNDAKIFIVTHRENISAFTILINGAPMEENPLETIKNCIPYEFTI